MQYSIDDRVRVTTDWFVEELRGAIGKIVLPPTAVKDQRASGIYWIEFDEPWPGNDRDHPIDSAEIDADFLQLVETDDRRLRNS